MSHFLTERSDRMSYVHGLPGVDIKSHNRSRASRLAPRMRIKRPLPPHLCRLSTLAETAIVQAVCHPLGRGLLGSAVGKAATDMTWQARGDDRSFHILSSEKIWLFPLYPAQSGCKMISRGDLVHHPEPEVHLLPLYLRLFCQVRNLYQSLFSLIFSKSLHKLALV